MEPLHDHPCGDVDNCTECWPKREDFAPFQRGKAHRNKDGSIDGSFALKEDVGMRITSVEVSEDGQTVTTRFEPLE